MAGKYYQKNITCCKEKHTKTIKIFLKKKKQKSVNMLANDMEIFLYKNELSQEEKTAKR